MALPKCYASRCRLIDASTHYRPAPGKILTVYPEFSTCCGDACDPCITIAKKCTVDLLRQLKDEYGFSQITLPPDNCVLLAAYEAGWKKEQVAINAKGDLGSLSFANKFWNVRIAQQRLAEWRISNPGKTCCPDGYSSFDDWIDSPQFKDSCPPLAYILFDEPWNAKYPRLLTYSGLFEKDLDPINLRTVTESDIKMLCSMNEMDLSSFWNSLRPQDRFFWYTVFVHECLQTKSNMTAYNSGWNNYWLDMVNITRTPYLVEGGSHYSQWIDTIAESGYDTPADWTMINSNSSTNDPRNATTRGWVSLQKNIHQLGDYFNKANALRWTDIGCFPQEDKEEWQSCHEYMKHLDVFREEAVRAGWLIKSVEGSRYECTVYRIPGCRDDDVLVGFNQF